MNIFPLLTLKQEKGRLYSVTISISGPWAAAKAIFTQASFCGSDRDPKTFSRAVVHPLVPEDVYQLLVRLTATVKKPCFWDHFVLGKKLSGLETTELGLCIIN